MTLDTAGTPVLSPASTASRASTGKLVLAALAAAALLSAAALYRPRQAADSAHLPGGVVRLALLSDTHVAGPEYSLGSENGQLDNVAITRTQQRLYRAVAALNAVRPRPQVRRWGLYEEAAFRTCAPRQRPAPLPQPAPVPPTLLPALQLAVFGGDVVHNGLEHLRELGLSAAGLHHLLSEPVGGWPGARTWDHVACWAFSRRGATCMAKLGGPIDQLH